MTLDEAVKFRKMVENAASNLPDAEAVQANALFELWSEKKDFGIGDRVCYNGALYRCYNPVTANPEWTPDVTPAHWEVFTFGESGTQDDPITAARGMRYFINFFYMDNEKIYKCVRDDTGDGTRLDYLPGELVGNYFEEVAT